MGFGGDDGDSRHPSLPRIVFLDVDGTITDRSGRVAPSVVEAVRTARGNGHAVFVCTGRARTEIPAIVTAIGFDGVISAGGGFVQLGEDLVARSTMPRAAVERLVAFFRAHDIDYVLQGFDGSYATTRLPARLAAALPPERFGGDAMRELTTRMVVHDGIPDEAIAKATFFGLDQSTYELVRDGLPDEYRVITGTMPYLGRAGGEVFLPGMDKGTAISALLRHLDRPLDDAIAIGDGSNDLEMLAVVGLGIAMGDAPDAVRAVADEVTTTAEDDGIWRAFRAHGLV